MSRNVVLASLRHNFQITSQQLDNALAIHFDLLAMDDTTTQLPHPDATSLKKHFVSAQSPPTTINGRFSFIG